MSVVENTEQLFLGVFQMQDARRIRAELKNREVEIEMRHNEQTCRTGGCSPTIELWGLGSDKDSIVQFFQEENQKIYGGLDINLEQINQVYDPTQSQVTCQACGFQFDPKSTECPDCGLSYS